MALFIPEGLRRMAYGGSIAGSVPVCLFSYVTNDLLSEVLTAGYFNTAYQRLGVGDQIMVAADQDGAPDFKILRVSVSDQTAGTVTVVPAGSSAAVADNSGGTAGAAISANIARQTIVLPVQLADLAAGTFKVALPFAFTVLSALFRTAKAATTAAKAATLTVGVNGVAVTGGVMALTSANQNAIGGSVPATAITATNTGTAGQTVEVTASAVTAFVEGDGYVEFTVRNDDLNNAIATLAAGGV